MYRACLVVALAAAACGGSSSTGNTTTTTNNTTGGVDVPLPPPDTCPLLLRCYQKVPELADCPDPVIRFKPHSTELTADSQTTLSGLATEIKQIGRLKKLLIEGHHAPEEAKSLAESRALSIQTRLVDKGVHNELLELHTERVNAGSNEVTLYVIDCSTEQAVAKPRGKSKSYWIILY